MLKNKAALMMALLMGERTNFSPIAVAGTNESARPIKSRIGSKTRGARSRSRRKSLARQKQAAKQTMQRRRRALSKKGRAS